MMNIGINTKIINIIMKFNNINIIKSLKNGMMFTVPISLISSIFILLAQFPVSGYSIWMSHLFGSGWREPLLQIYNTTMGIMAIVAVMGITYDYVKRQNQEPFIASIMSLVVFLATSDLSAKTLKGEVLTKVINMDWLGGKGMVSAIIIGLAVGIIYSWLVAKNITIKMPKSVPKEVANAFTVLIPSAIIAVFAMFIYIFFKYAMNTTFINFIYKLLQIPLQKVSDSLPGILFVTVAISFLWWFGINGSAVVNGVFGSIIAANTLDNQDILNRTGFLTVTNGAHIVTQQFQAQFVSITGSGITIGFVMLALLFGKSKQIKMLGKLSLIPSIFNINEPVIFAVPIVMNPFLLFPFIVVPVIAVLITYLSIVTGIISPFTGVTVPWTTPAIISGFLIGGWKAAILQMVIMLISIMIYLPFFKVQDNINLKEEGKMTDANAAVQNEI